MKEKRLKLNLEDRLLIQKLLDAGNTKYNVCKTMDRAYVTIHREVKLNSVNGKYYALEADRLSKDRQLARFRSFTQEEIECIKQMAERKSSFKDIVRTIKCAKNTLNKFFKENKMQTASTRSNTPGVLERLDALEEQMKIVFDVIKDK